VSATFNPALTSNRDWLRFRLGDRDTTAPLFPDATYDAVLVAAGSITAALQTLAAALIAEYSRKPEVVDITGALKAEWKSRLATWQALAGGGTTAYDGGGMVIAMPRRPASTAPEF